MSAKSAGALRRKHLFVLRMAPLFRLGRIGSTGLTAPLPFVRRPSAVSRSSDLGSLWRPSHRATARDHSYGLTGEHDVDGIEQNGEA